MQRAFPPVEQSLKSRIIEIRTRHAILTVILCLKKSELFSIKSLTRKNRMMQFPDFWWFPLFEARLEDPPTISQSILDFFNNLNPTLANT